MNVPLLLFWMLVSTSFIMAASLWLAWRMFDRPGHALSWALAFLCGGFQWGISALAVMHTGSHLLAALAAGACGAAMMSLVAWGARQRAGLPRGARGLLIGWLIFLLIYSAACLAVDDPAARRIVLNLYSALLLFDAARHLRPAGRLANLSETALAWVMRAVIAAYLLVSAVTAAGGMVERSYSLILCLTLPPLGIALGMALGFLLAGDVGERLHALVTRDPLTGALNRRGLEQAAAAAVAGARRQRRPLTLVVADLDRFKAINDAGGHAAGDRALSRFAEVAQRTIRGEDLLARLGGDEFCLLLPGTSPDTASVAVERIREALRDEITVSFGIAVLHEGESLNALIARADEALYRAKAEGRDRTILARGLASV